MKKGKIVRAALLVSCGLMLSGCADKMPNLTEEQNALIAEYIGDLLMKYSPNFDYKLVDLDEISVVEVSAEEATETSTEETSETAQEETTEVDASEAETAEESATQTETASEEAQPQLTASDVEIGGFIEAPEGIDIEYTGYELASRYPTNNSGFAVTPPSGSQLLIVHFKATNSGSESATLDVFSNNVSMYATVNDTSSKEVMTTLLDNDFTTYTGDVVAGGDVELDAVFAIDSDITQIDNLSIRVQYNSESLEFIAE